MRALMAALRPPSVPGAEEILRRDALFSGTRSVAKVLSAALGAQLILRMGGAEGHVAILYAALFVGLLASGVFGGAAPAGPLRRTQTLSYVAIGSIAFLGFLPSGPLTATALTALLAASAAFAGLGMPLLSAAYARLYPAAVRGQVVAWTRLIWGLGSLAALLCLGPLIERYPWTTWPAYGLVGAVGLVSAWRLCALLDDDPSARASGGGLLVALRVLRTDSAFARFQLFTFGLGMANLMANPLLAIYVSKRLELGLAAAVLVVPHGVVEQGLRLATVRLHGRLYDSIGVVAHRTLSSALMAGGFALWAFVDNVWMAAAAAALVGLGRGGGQIIWLIGPLDFAPDGQESEYSALHTLLTGLRGVVAPTLALWLLTGPAEGSYFVMLLICAGLTAVSTLGHALFVPSQRRT